MPSVDEKPFTDPISDISKLRFRRFTIFRPLRKTNGLDLKLLQYAEQN